MPASPSSPGCLPHAQLRGGSAFEANPTLSSMFDNKPLAGSPADLEEFSLEDINRFMAEIQKPAALPLPDGAGKTRSIGDLLASPAVLDPALYDPTTTTTTPTADDGSFGFDLSAMTAAAVGHGAYEPLPMTLLPPKPAAAAPTTTTTIDTAALAAATAAEAAAAALEQVDDFAAFVGSPACSSAPTSPGGPLRPARKARGATATAKGTGLPAGRKRRPKQAVPDEKKDAKYWERRRKNTLAARRNREMKRRQQQELNSKLPALDEEKRTLEQEVVLLNSQLAELRQAVFAKLRDMDLQA